MEMELHAVNAAAATPTCFAAYFIAQQTEELHYSCSICCMQFHFYCNSFFLNLGTGGLCNLAQEGRSFFFFAWEYCFFTYYVYYFHFVFVRRKKLLYNFWTFCGLILWCFVLVFKYNFRIYDLMGIRLILESTWWSNSKSFQMGHSFASLISLVVVLK